ncbi:PAS domain-containing protein, partial [Alistipes onderdonkii]
MLTVLDRDGTLVELVSADETNHVGVPGGELAGQNIRTMLSPAACRNVKNNLDNVFATGCGSSSHHDITLDGRTRNYENRIFPLDGEHALCICRDITEAEAAKHELEMVKYALNNVDEEIYACSLDGTMEYANEQFRVRHDVEGDLSQHKVYDFWSYEGSRLQWEARLAKIRRDNGSHKYTVRFKNEQGRIVAWDIVAYIIYDYFQEREIVWFFGRDVTQRIEHENKVKVKEMNSILECILNNIPVYLFVKDPGNEFRYLYWNRAFEEYSRIPASRALGHTDYEIFPSPKDAEHFRQDDLTLLRTGERQTFIEEYVSATGETRIVNTSKSLVPVENRLPLIIGVSWDITDMKNAELEIVEARIRAEESDRLKSAFLANMSHEIRTPLNAIVGFAKLIGEVETEEEKQQFIDIIDVNSELLLQLINDILDISKIEAGTLEFRFRPMNLNDLCRSELEVHKPRVKPGVELVFEERVANVEIVCDQNRLAQVIVNTSKSLVPVENRLPLIIGVSWDITDMKNAELEIVEARIRAEESDRLKSAFLANMSHEIRTPLNAIVGFAKLIGEVETEEEKQQFIDIIDVNSELLLQLINDILDISKIEAGTLEFRFRPMNLNDLCRSELEVHKPRVKPGVELVFEERVANVEIVCDQNRLAQ